MSGLGCRVLLSCKISPVVVLLFFGGFRLRLDFATRGHVGLHENNFFG